MVLTHMLTLSQYLWAQQHNGHPSPAPLSCKCVVCKPHQQIWHLQARSCLLEPLLHLSLRLPLLLYPTHPCFLYTYNMCTCPKPCTHTRMRFHR